MKTKVNPKIDQIKLRPPKGGLGGLKSVYLTGVADLLNNDIFPVLEQEFRPEVERIDILESVQKYAEFSVKNWIGKAFDHCKPFCNFDPVDVPNGYFSMTLIGVPDILDKRYKKAVGKIEKIGNVQLVSTGNKNEIRIHSIMTALPAFSVSGIDRYKQVYEYYCDLAKKDPQLHVHIDNKWCDKKILPDLFPEDR